MWPVGPSTDTRPNQEQMAGMDDEEGQFIFHLQPAIGSEIHDFLRDARKTSRTVFGSDDSYLYAPHVSMSGWVKTTRGKAVRLAQRLQVMADSRVVKRAAAMHSMPTGVYATVARTPVRVGSTPDLGVERKNDVFADLPSTSPDPASSLSRPVQEAVAARPPPLVVLGDIITTEDGYVLMDVHAPFVKQLIRDLADQAAEEGIPVRGKPINHITLANGRNSSAERDEIKKFWWSGYREPWRRFDECDWRIVMYEMKERTPPGGYEMRGPHHLVNVVEIPLTNLDNLFDHGQVDSVGFTGVDQSRSRHIMRSFRIPVF